MAQERIEVGIVVEKRRLKGPWAEFAWRPVAVLPGAPATPAWTVLSQEGEATHYYAGALILELFRSDTGMYRDNIASGTPSLWVVLAESEDAPGVALRSVTADPAEGEALTEPGSEIVEMVPMPAEIAARLAAFVAAHHVEQTFFKRRRDRADTEALAFRPRIGTGTGPRREDEE